MLSLIYYLQWVVIYVAVSLGDISLYLMTLLKRKKGKAIPVAGHEGP
jgi:hypothetical protein